MFFTIENEKDNRMSFLDLKIIPKQETSAYHETTFILTIELQNWHKQYIPTQIFSNLLKLDIFI